MKKPNKQKHLINIFSTAKFTTNINPPNKGSKIRKQNTAKKMNKIENNDAQFKIYTKN